MGRINSREFKSVRGATKFVFPLRRDSEENRALTPSGIASKIPSKPGTNGISSRDLPYSLVTISILVIILDDLRQPLFLEIFFPILPDLILISLLSRVFYTRDFLVLRSRVVIEAHLHLICLQAGRTRGHRRHAAMIGSADRREISPNSSALHSIRIAFALYTRTKLYSNYAVDKGRLGTESRARELVDIESA